MAGGSTPSWPSSARPCTRAGEKWRRARAAGTTDLSLLRGPDAGARRAARLGLLFASPALGNQVIRRSGIQLAVQAAHETIAGLAGSSLGCRGRLCAVARGGVQQLE